MSQANHNQEKKSALIKSQDCVRCGLCLPHCPTFNLKKDERYSPRGRIMMMQGYGLSKLNLIEADEYLSTCLNCLNCQAMCPAEVDYQSLIHQFQVEKFQNFADKKSKIMISILTHPFGNYILLIFSRFARMFQLSFFAQFLNPSFLKTALLTSSLINFVQPRRVKTKGIIFNQQKLTHQQKIILFAGCSQGFSSSLLSKSDFLLTRMGLEVEVMSNFGCCGALQYHQGNEEVAKKSGQNLHQKFKDHTLVLVAQSGCNRHIQSQVFKQNIENEAKIEYQDLSQFLFNQLDDSNLKFKKWQFGKVFLHLPCTQRYPLQSSFLLNLMQKIEGMNFEVIDWGCCGSAGSYLFSKPNESEQLGQQMIREIEEKLKFNINQLNYLITTNIGCKIQFHRIFASEKQFKHIKIVHPIEIFADLIED